MTVFREDWGRGGGEGHGRGTGCDGEGDGDSQRGNREVLQEVHDVVKPKE